MKSAHGNDEIANQTTYNSANGARADANDAMPSMPPAWFVDTHLGWLGACRFTVAQTLAKIDSSKMRFRKK